MGGAQQERASRGRSGGPVCPSHTQLDPGPWDPVACGAQHSRAHGAPSLLLQELADWLGLGAEGRGGPGRGEEFPQDTFTMETGRERKGVPVRVLRASHEPVGSKCCPSAGSKPAEKTKRLPQEQSPQHSRNPGRAEAVTQCRCLCFWGRPGGGGVSRGQAHAAARAPPQHAADATALLSSLPLPPLTPHSTQEPRRQRHALGTQP